MIKATLGVGYSVRVISSRFKVLSVKYKYEFLLCGPSETEIYGNIQTQEAIGALVNKIVLKSDLDEQNKNKWHVGCG